MHRTSVNPDTAAKQAVRMRLFFIGLTTYAGCGALVLVYAWLGYLPTWLAVSWSLGAATVNALFFLAIRFGWNLRMRDASMTQLQLVVAMIAALVVISQADRGRGALLMLLPVPVLFGVLRLNFAQMARIGLVGVAGYALVIILGSRAHFEQARLELELLNLGSLTLVMLFVCVMCGYISKVRVDLAVALARISELAERDPLTGLFNRRALLEKLETEIGRCERRMRRGITLCMVDIDRFKRINDTFGHPVGDEVIQIVGQCLVTSARVIDGVFRYGGEEFIVIFEDDSAVNALTACERMRSLVAQLRVSSAPELRLTVSIGVACFRRGENGRDLIARADKALYAAKSNGRNCVFEAPSLASVAATTT